MGFLGLRKETVLNSACLIGVISFTESLIVFGFGLMTQD